MKYDQVGGSLQRLIHTHREVERGGGEEGGRGGERGREVEGGRDVCVACIHLHGV